MVKYELFCQVDLKGNEWNVMQLNEPMTKEEIDKICEENRIDEVRYPDK
jgi:hypothetical protein